MIVRDEDLALQRPAELLEGAVEAVEPAPAARVASEPVKPRHSKGKWVAWTLAMVGVGGAVGAVIILGLKFIDGPVVTKPDDPVLSKSQAATVATPEVNQLAGLYVTFNYPGVFDQMSQAKGDANTLEQYMLSSKSGFSRSIASSVRKLPTGIANDDSGYRFRKLNPQDYEEQVTKLAGETVNVLTKKDHTENTLFWAHQNMILSVSITSNDPHDDLVDFMRTVESKLRWVK